LVISKKTTKPLFRTFSWY